MPSSDTSSILYRIGQSVTNKIAELVGNKLVPVGTVQYFSSPTAPGGWHICDGTQLDTTMYSDLFNVIGYMYGGTGSLFSLPDLRGEFIRGADLGRGIDTDRDGAAVGSMLGNLQLSEFESHNHGGATGSHDHGGATGSHDHGGYTGYHSHSVYIRSTEQEYYRSSTYSRTVGSDNVTSVGTTSERATISGDTASISGDTASISSDGGIETRPRNVILLPIIKL
jgi:microcystin-dependent protein